MKSSSATPARTLISDIKNKIKGNTAIVGIGNPLRGDDGFGPKVIEALKKKNVKADLFDCGTAPENYIFPILAASCDTIILVDTANFDALPGEIRILDTDKISNTSFSTHNPSPILFIDLLKTGRENLNIFVISIQPKSTVLGESISEEVKKGLDVLVNTFSKIL